MANQSELAQLHDLHMPTPISWWPFASGWYTLAFLLVFIVLLSIFLGRHIYLRGKAKRQALKLLQTYQDQYQGNPNSQLYSAQISELLKRVALVYYPRTEVASLQGDAWLAFLNDTAKNVDFTEVRFALVELPYQPVKEYDLQPLFTLAKYWIRQRRKPCLS